MSDGKKELSTTDLILTLVKPGKGGLQIKTPLAALDIVNNIVNASREVAKFTEEQITKRCEIEKEKQIAIAEIQKQRDVLLLYLEKTFDERKSQFSKFFDIVDHALQSGNMQELAVGLDNINRLANSSPFKNLTDLNSVSAALENKNTEWDF